MRRRAREGRGGTQRVGAGRGEAVRGGERRREADEEGGGGAEEGGRERGGVGRAGAG